MDNTQLKVFSGTSNPELAKEICDCLLIPLGNAQIIRFANDNIFVQVQENVREKDVFVVQTSAPPVNDHIMELLIMIDALRSASAARVTAVLPYFPYARSDKKDQPRVSITARLVADLLETAGAHRVLTMGLHSPQIHGFFNIPTDHLLATKPLCDYFAQRDLTNHVVVAPDAGSARRAGPYAERLDLPIAICDKRRVGNTDLTEIVGVVGDVEGKQAIIFDDEISTASSLMEVCHALTKHNVASIRAGCAHGVFCGPAIERIRTLPVVEVVTTNTVPLPPENRLDKIKVISVARLFAEAVTRIHTGESVSSLF